MDFYTWRFRRDSREQEESSGFVGPFITALAVWMIVLVGLRAILQRSMATPKDNKSLELRWQPEKKPVVLLMPPDYSHDAPMITAIASGMMVYDIRTLTSGNRVSRKGGGK